jgi:hypothetical protein
MPTQSLRVPITCQCAVSRHNKANDPERLPQQKHCGGGLLISIEETCWAQNIRTHGCAYSRKGPLP